MSGGKVWRAKVFAEHPELRPAAEREQLAREIGAKGSECYWCEQGVGHIHRVELENNDDVDVAIKAVELGDAGAAEAALLAEEVWRLRSDRSRRCDVTSQHG